MKASSEAKLRKHKLPAMSGQHARAQRAVVDPCLERISVSWDVRLQVQSWATTHSASNIQRTFSCCGSFNFL